MFMTHFLRGYEMGCTDEELRLQDLTPSPGPLRQPDGTFCPLSSPPALSLPKNRLPWVPAPSDLLFAGFSAPGPEYFRQCAVPPASPDLLIKLELLGPRAPMWGQGGIRRVSRPHAAVQPLSYNPGRNQPTGALKLLWCRWARLPILLSDL